MSCPSTCTLLKATNTFYDASGTQLLMKPYVCSLPGSNAMNFCNISGALPHTCFTHIERAMTLTCSKTGHTRLPKRRHQQSVSRSECSTTASFSWCRKLTSTRCCPLLLHQDQYNDFKKKQRIRSNTKSIPNWRLQEPFLFSVNHCSLMVVGFHPPQVAPLK